MCGGLHPKELRGEGSGDTRGCCRWEVGVGGSRIHSSPGRREAGFLLAAAPESLVCRRVKAASTDSW